MIFLAKLGIGVVGAALVGGAALSSKGFIYVKVHEHQREAPISMCWFQQRLCPQL